MKNIAVLALFFLAASSPQVYSMQDRPQLMHIKSGTMSYVTLSNNYKIDDAVMLLFDTHIHSIVAGVRRCSELIELNNALERPEQLSKIIQVWLHALSRTLDNYIQTLIKMPVPADDTTTRFIDYPKALKLFKKSIPAFTSRCVSIMPGGLLNRAKIVLLLPSLLCSMLQNTLYFNLIVDSPAFGRTFPLECQHVGNYTKEYIYANIAHYSAVTQTTYSIQPQSSQIYQRALLPASKAASLSTAPAIQTKRKAEDASQLLQEAKRSKDIHYYAQANAQHLITAHVLLEHKKQQYSARLAAHFSLEHLQYLDQFLADMPQAYGENGTWLEFLVSDPFFALQPEDYHMIFQACKLKKYTEFQTIVSLCKN